MTAADENIIELKDLKICLAGAWVHNGLNLTVKRGEILAIVGGSGAGKSVLLREILMLQPPTSGSVRIFGEEIMKLDLKQLIAIQRRWGVLFQQCALFSSLTTLENIAFPLRELTHLRPKDIQELAMLKLLAVGLSADSAPKYPNELSGGMQKRAALARACVLDPELLFLDEPSSGLDPESAAAFDELVLNLHATLGLTIVMVTHDLDSLWQVTDRVAFLGEGRILEVAPMEELVKSSQPMIKEYFTGPRGRVTAKIYENKSTE